MSRFLCSASAVPWAVLGPEWGSSPFPTPHRGKSPETEAVERPFGEKRPEPLQPAPPPPPLPSQYTPASSLTFHTLTKGVHSEGRCRALRLGGLCCNLPVPAVGFGHSAEGPLLGGLSLSLGSWKAKADGHDAALVAQPMSTGARG